MNRHPKTDDLDFRCCWTCSGCVLDLGRSGYVCRHDDGKIEGSPHAQVCDDWHR